MQFLTEILKKFPDVYKARKKRVQKYIDFCLEDIEHIEHRYEGIHEKYLEKKHHISPKNEECFSEFSEFSEFTKDNKDKHVGFPKDYSDTQKDECWYI